MTIRLSAEQAEALETVASIEDRPVSEVIRAAIAEPISTPAPPQRQECAITDSREFNEY